jgi:hypothetical protein
VFYVSAGAETRREFEKCSMGNAVKVLKRRETSSKIFEGLVVYLTGVQNALKKRPN